MWYAIVIMYSRVSTILRTNGVQVLLQHMLDKTPPLLRVCLWTGVVILMGALLLSACKRNITPPADASLTQQRLFIPMVQRSQQGMMSPASPAVQIAVGVPAPVPDNTLVEAPAPVPDNTTVYAPFVAAAEPLPVVATPPPFDPTACTVYPDVRITWYELGSCCGKEPGHPQYGITSSGLPVQWGMAAVQAQQPLLPMGTRFIVATMGPEYQFVVTDTGSETAFGSAWIDLYAPSIEDGRKIEQIIGLSGRSDVLVCPP